LKNLKTKKAKENNYFHDIRAKKVRSKIGHANRSETKRASSI